MSLAICAWCLRPVEPATEWVILPTTHKGVIRLCETCQAEPDQARIAAALGYTPEDLDLAQRMAQAEPASLEELEAAAAIYDRLVIE